MHRATGYKTWGRLSEALAEVLGALQSQSWSHQEIWDVMGFAAPSPAAHECGVSHKQRTQVRNSPVPGLSCLLKREEKLELPWGAKRKRQSFV